MAFKNYKWTNLAKWQLKAGISAWAWTIILKAWQWDLFPSTFPFPLKIEKYDSSSLLENKPVLKREMVECTNRVNDTLTITRAIEDCPENDTAVTQTSIAFSFDADDWVYLVYSAWNDKDIKDELNLKANDSEVVHNTWDEQIDWIKSFQKFPTTAEEMPLGNYQVANKKYVDDLLVESQTQHRLANGYLIAAESGNKWDLLFSEDPTLFVNATVKQNIWDVVWNTRVNICRFGSWNLWDTIKLSLDKVWSPSVDLKVRWETDNGSEPSWILIDTNAIATIPAWSLVTSLADTNIAITAPIVIPRWQKYWIVLYQGTYGSETINSSNYYQAWYEVKNSILNSSVLWNWSTYVANVNKKFYCINWNNTSWTTTVTEDFSWVWRPTDWTTTGTFALDTNRLKHTTVYLWEQDWNTKYDIAWYNVSIESDLDLSLSSTIKTRWGVSLYMDINNYIDFWIKYNNMTWWWPYINYYIRIVKWWVMVVDTQLEATWWVNKTIKLSYQNWVITIYKYDTWFVPLWTYIYEFTQPKYPRLFMSNDEVFSWWASYFRDNAIINFINNTSWVSEEYVLAKTNADYEYKLPDIPRFAIDDYSIWDIIKCDFKWISKLLTWLSVWANYYVSNTPWAISTIAWTNKNIIWYQKDDWLLLQNIIENNTTLNANNSTSSIYQAKNNCLVVYNCYYNADWTLLFQESLDWVTFNTIFSFWSSVDSTNNQIRWSQTVIMIKWRYYRNTASSWSCTVKTIMAL